MDRQSLYSTSNIIQNLKKQDRYNQNVLDEIAKHNTANIKWVATQFWHWLISLDIEQLTHKVGPSTSKNTGRKGS